MKTLSQKTHWILCLIILLFASRIEAQRDYTYRGLDPSNPNNFFAPANWQCLPPDPACTFPSADDTARIGRVITGGYDVFSPSALGGATVKNLHILHGSGLSFTNFTTTATFNLGDLPTSTGTLASIGSGAVFNNNGTMSVLTTTGGSSVFAGSFTFFNNGTFNLNKLTMTGGPTIVNQPNASIFIGDFSIGGGFWTFNNLGFLNKPSSPGTATLTLVNFTNSGTVEVGNGTLVLGASGSTVTSNCGRFSTNSPTGILQILAPFTANACPPFAPPGDVASNLYGSGQITMENIVTLNGGDLRFGFRHPTSGIVTGGNVRFQSDSILGNGNIRIVADALNPTTFTALSGTIGGTGSFDIESGGTFNINGPAAGAIGLNGRTVNNAGTIIWTSGGFTNGTTSFTLNNQIGGVFEARNNNNFFSTTSPQSVFNNAGIFRKTTGTGVTGISLVFNNTGTVDAQSGTLRFTSTAPNSNSFAGTFNIASGGVIEFASSSGGFNFNPGFNSTGGGVIRIVSGVTTTVNAPVTLSNLELTGGTINGTGAANVLRLTGLFSRFENGSTLNNTRLINQGSLLLQSNVFFNNGTTLDNEGTLNAPHNTSLRQQAGGAFNFNNSGNVNPGLPLGTLFMDGNYTQGSTGTLNIEIGGTTPGTQHDQLRVFNGTASGTGIANLGGTVNVNFVNGFVPAQNNFFQIMTCQTGCNGQFSQINGVNVGTDKILVPGYGPNAVSLITTSISQSINSPLLSSAISFINNRTRITGRFVGAPNTTYLITYYLGCGGSGQSTLRGQAETTDSAGVKALNLDLPFRLAPGTMISARATDANNLTSDVSNCVSVTKSYFSFDFDGDGSTDFSAFRRLGGSLAEAVPGYDILSPQANSIWFILNSSNGSVGGGQFGFDTDKIAPGDYDGDGKADMAVFRPSNGVWYVQKSDGTGFIIVQFGINGDLPRPGDFDGDGKSDVGVFRPSTGDWYWVRSSDGQVGAVHFGQNGDIPIMADVDGDGTSDLTVFRPSTGVWFWLRSSDGGFSGAQFGLNGDVPVAGDYDGDGKTDVAVWRPSTGVWYVQRSSDGGYNIVQWGVNSDIAAQGDYDGDGKTDYTVFRPSGGDWYVLRSSDGGFNIVHWGANGDIPVPSAYNRP